MIENMKIKLQKVYITLFIFEPFSIHIHILLFNQIRVNNIITSIAAALCQFQFVMPCSLEPPYQPYPKLYRVTNITNIAFLG